MTGADALTLTAAVIGVLAALVKIYVMDVDYPKDETNV